MALARIFFQPHGRGKGPKASKSSLQTKSASVLDPNENIFLEVELRPGGKLEVLPQAVFTDRNTGIIFRLSDPAIASAFLDSIRTLLTDKLPLIQKTSGPKAKRFKIADAYWGQNGYLVDGAVLTGRPSARGLWIDALNSKGEAVGSPNYPRLFQRSAGQFVLRVDDYTTIGSLLTSLRTVLGISAVEISTKEQTIEQPGLRMALEMQINVMERVLAKVGINFAVHELGDDFVRHSGFDQVKRAIRLGEPKIGMVSAAEGDDLHALLSAIPHSLHVMALATVPADPGKCHLAFLIRLYGSSTFMVSLAENIPLPSVPLPIFFTVDYQIHKIERLTPIEFIQSFPPTDWVTASKVQSLQKNTKMVNIMRIASGGQTGADRAALDWAIAHDIPHGGWCPKGRKAEDGVIPDQYQLVEMPDDEGYLRRTEANVRDSDATLIISIGPRLTGGSKNTARFAKKLSKPWLHVHPGMDWENVLAEWLGATPIRALNVAGPRLSNEPNIEAFVWQVLDWTAESFGPRMF